MRLMYWQLSHPWFVLQLALLFGMRLSVYCCFLYGRVQRHPQVACLGGTENTLCVLFLTVCWRSGGLLAFVGGLILLEPRWVTHLGFLNTPMLISLAVTIIIWKTLLRATTIRFHIDLGIRRVFLTGEETTAEPAWRLIFGENLLLYSLLVSAIISISQGLTVRGLFL